LKLFYNRFSAAVKESSYGKTVAAEIEKRKIGVPGTAAAVFNTVDINGTNSAWQIIKENMCCSISGRAGACPAAKRTRI
jgi:uncharacterized membrane protein